MRVLLCNKFYYRRGGDCIYTINLEKMLSDHGHTTAVFAMDCQDTIETEWRKYFPPEVSFSGIRHKLHYAARCLGESEVGDRFGRLLDDFHPDVVHLNNIHSQLSPVIARIAHHRGIKVVWTLHDYKLLCPRYDCLKRGQSLCEECLSGKIGVLLHSCMKNSFAASCVAFAEAIKWNRRLLERNTDMFICPSRFMKDMMVKGGFSDAKLSHLCNSIDVSVCAKDNYTDRGEYYCYVGRLSHEKGIATLLKSASRLPYKLIVVGGGPLAGSFPDLPNVEFAGYQDWTGIKDIVGHAKFTVIPSEWYENNPLSVIESLCLGTPVLGARIGGIPELIDEGCTGFVFESGNVEMLAEKIKDMYDFSFDYEAVAEASRMRFNQDAYYHSLMEIYKG